MENPAIIDDNNDDSSQQQQQHYSSAIDDDTSLTTSTTISEIAGTSHEEIGFRFEVKRACRLKQAIEALCDRGLNPAGVGRIDVDGNGVGITVGNSSDVHGFLWLKSVYFRGFECSQPMVGKLVDLRKISENLVVDEKDVVTVAYIFGSNEISFSFGNTRYQRCWSDVCSCCLVMNFGEPNTRSFTIEVLENTVVIPEFPHVTVFCEAAIPCHDVDTLVEQLFQSEGSQLVSVNLAKATIYVGKDKTPSLSSDHEDMGFDGHHAWFYWPYPEALKKAARLCHAFQVSFTSTPPNTVMLRFSLQELGDLMFLKEAAEMVPNLDARLPEISALPVTPLGNPTAASSEISKGSQSTDIAGPSRETLSTVATSEISETLMAVKSSEHSDEKPSNNEEIGFRFELRAIPRLKQAIEVLCDPTFNPDRVGRIDVYGNGVAITVGNTSDGHGCLWLQDVNLGGFQCRMHMVGKLVDLRKISENLVVDEEDALIVAHIAGSNHISFSFGEDPTRAFTIEVLENTVVIPEFPCTITTLCSTVLPCHALDTLVEQLIQREGQLVSVRITSMAALIVGRGGTPGSDQFRIMGGAERTYHGSFYWRYPEALKKAARLYYAVKVDFASTPPNTVMLRFNLPELGKLVFLKEAVIMVPIQRSAPSVANPNTRSETSVEILTAVSESSPENPPEHPPADILSEVSQQNPPTDIAGPSQQTPPTVGTSDISKESPSADVAVLSLETPSTLCTSEISKEGPSADVAGPSQVNPSTVAVSEILKESQFTDVAGPSKVTPTTVAISELLKESQSTDVPGPSQRDPSTDTAGPSRGNPSNNDNNGFSFKLKSATTLKLATEALSDPKFNPSGTGRIDVNVKGFSITVGKPSDVHARLWLRPPGFQKFKCSTPVSGKLVNLREISEKLIIDDKDPVSISYLNGSNICIVFGNEEPARAFMVELLQNDAEIPEFPKVTIFCSADVPHPDPDTLVGELILGETPATVVFDVKPKVSKIFVGTFRPIVNYDAKEEGFYGTRGKAGEELRHQATFDWHYPELLQKAVHLSDGFQIGFASTPHDTVMMKLTLPLILSELTFLKGADKMIICSAFEGID